MQKILISGAGGFVGARLVKCLEGRYELTAFPRGMLHQADRAQVEAYAARARPDVIVHLAAISDTQRCEKDPNASYRANVLLTEWLCGAAKKTGAKAICFSSDQVYNGSGRNGPFSEDISCAPINVYGRHKLEAEQRALSALPSAVMLRASWMYDLPGYGLPIRDNLLVRLIRCAMENRPARFSTTDWRGVTYVRQAAGLLEQTFALPGGVYNFGSDGPLDMYAVACDALGALGLAHRADGLLLPDGSQPPRCLRMDGAKLARFGVRFDDNAAGIRRCLRDYGLAAMDPGDPPDEKKA